MAMYMPGLMHGSKVSCEREHIFFSYSYTVTDMLVLGHCCNSGFGGSLVDPEQPLSWFCIVMLPAISACTVMHIGF